MIDDAENEGPRQTPRLQSILAAMAQRARSGGHGFVGVEHLILALLDEPTVVHRLHLDGETRESLRTELESDLTPSVRDSAFPTSPQPWGSILVTDDSGDPVLRPDGRPLQYLVDAEGQPVRDASGALQHLVLDEAGDPVRDAEGRPRLEAINVP